METESIRRVLSLLKVGGQSQTIIVRPAALPPGGEPRSASDYERSPKRSLVPWYAYLWIERGQVSSCELYNEQGSRLLAGAQAMEFLEQCGRLNWQVAEPSSIPLPQPSQPGGGQAEWRPVRTALGTSMLHNPSQLPRDYRRLLALINGRYTVEDLCRLLGLPKFEDLDRMLHALKDSGLIE